MHQDSQVAKRYARSLLTYAIEKNQLDAVKEDMSIIANTCRSSKELVVMLRSPIVKTDQKVTVLNKIFVGKIGTITAEFLKIVARKRRERIIPDIAHSFVELYREHKGIVLAEITTAHPLSDSERKKAMQLIMQLNDNVELKEKLDDNIIGGFIIRVGDMQYDDSVASKLTAMRTEFLKNPYIAKL